jgi:hypothetical protein
MSASLAAEQGCSRKQVNTTMPAPVHRIKALPMSRGERLILKKQDYDEGDA